MSLNVENTSFQLPEGGGITGLLDMTLGSQETEKQFYYNIETTDNPYIIIYTRVTNPEELTDNFKIGRDTYSGMEILRRIKQDCNYVLDKKMINTALLSYKKQLTEDEAKSIIDPHLFDPLMGWHLRAKLYDFELSFNTKNEIILLKSVKACAANDEPRAPTPRQNSHMICDFFKAVLERLTKAKLKAHFRIYITSNNIHGTLLAFKQLFPTLTYEGLIKEYPYVSETITKTCEEYWNNPELTKKPKPGKAKKAKKEKK